MDVTNLETVLERKKAELEKLQQQMLKVEHGRRSQRKNKSTSQSVGRRGSKLLGGASASQNIPGTPHSHTSDSLMASDVASWRGTPSSATRSGRGIPLSAHQAGEWSTTTPLLQVEHTDTAVILGGKELGQSRRKQEYATISQAGSLVRCSQDPHSPIWMEGMEYPAQYLVRQTRSMSAKLSDDGKEESPIRIFRNSPVSGKLKTSPEESSRDPKESSRDPEVMPLIVSFPITQRFQIKVGIGQEEEEVHMRVSPLFPPCIPTSYHQDFFLPDERFQSLKLQKLRTLQEAKKLKPRGEELVRVKTLRCEHLLEGGYSQQHGSDELVQPPVLQPAQQGPDKLLQPAQQGPDKLLQPAQQGPDKLLQPAQQGPDKLLQPAQQGPDKLLQPAQQGPVLQPAQPGPDKLLQPAQQGPDKLLQPAQQGPDKLLQPTQQGPVKLLQPAQQGPDKLLQPAQQGPVLQPAQQGPVLQPAQQEPDKLLQPAQQGPDMLLQPAQQGPVLQPAQQGPDKLLQPAQQGPDKLLQRAQQGPDMLQWQEPDSLQTAVFPDDMSDGPQPYSINDDKLCSLMCSVYHHHGETSKMQRCAGLRCDTEKPPHCGRLQVAMDCGSNWLHIAAVYTSEVFVYSITANEDDSNWMKKTWILGEGEAIQKSSLLCCGNHVILFTGGDYHGCGARMYVIGGKGHSVVNLGAASSDRVALCTAVCAWAASTGCDLGFAMAQQSSDRVDVRRVTNENGSWSLSGSSSLPLAAGIGNISSLNHVETSCDWVVGVGDMSLLLWDASEGVLLRSVSLGCSSAATPRLQPVSLTARLEQGVIFLVLGSEQASGGPSVCRDHWLLALTNPGEEPERQVCSCHCRLLRTYTYPSTKFLSDVRRCHSCSVDSGELAVLVSPNTVALWRLASVSSAPDSEFTIRGGGPEFRITSFYWLGSRNQLFIMDNNNTIHVFKVI